MDKIYIVVGTSRAKTYEDTAVETKIDRLYSNELKAERRAKHLEKVYGDFYDWYVRVHKVH